MTISVSSPAMIFDMAELCGARTQLHWAVAKDMWAAGDTFAVHEGDELLAVLGLYPIEGGAEAWFNARPALARHMLSVVRQVRLTLTALPYPEIVVVCTTKAGCRFAAACGFTFVEHHENGDIYAGRFGK